MANTEGLYAKKDTQSYYDEDEDINADDSNWSFDPKEKLVTMDFGVLNERRVDSKNKKSFETNTAFVLLQLMQKYTFVTLLDLNDGDENKIVYPYGFNVKADQTRRLLENLDNTQTESSPQGDNQPEITSNENPNTGDSPFPPSPNSDSDKEDDNRETENSNQKPTEEKPKNTKLSQEWELEEIKWDNMDANWDEISYKINKNFWKAYFNEDRTNEDYIFSKVASILSKISMTHDPKRSDFIFGNSRDYATSNVDGQHRFNMFIDFAYSAGFNSFNIPFTHAHSEARKFLLNIPSVNTAFRTFAFQITFTRFSDSQGDEKSVRNRQFMYQTQHPNVVSEEKYKYLKILFGAPDFTNTSTHNIYEQGDFGSSSRFISMIFSLSDIIQPSIDVDYAGLTDSSKVEYYEDSDEKNFNKYIKEINGNLQLSLRVKGCLEGVKLYHFTGEEVTITNIKFLPDKNEYLADVEIPVQYLNNPYEFDEKKLNPDDKNMKFPLIGIPIDAPKDYEQNRKPIPLRMKINERTNNMRGLKIKLECKSLGLESEKLLKQLPQSHLVRGIMDPGYYIKNPNTKKIDFKTPNRVFQINFQDISKLDSGYLVLQKFFSNIDIISDMNINFRFADKTSMENVAINDIDDKEVMFELDGDKSVMSRPRYESYINMFTYDLKLNQIKFDDNLVLLSKNWTFDVKMYGDIGCCTTNTQGRTVMQIYSDKSKPISIAEKLISTFNKTRLNDSHEKYHINTKQIDDPYGLMFFDMIGNGVQLQYNGSIPIHLATNGQIHRILDDQNKFNNDFEKKQDSIKEIVNKTSASSSYDFENLFSFGFLSTNSPVTTPFIGLMCSDRNEYYLQIIPTMNTSFNDLENDNVGNMFYQIQLFTSKPIYLFLIIFRKKSSISTGN